MSVAPMSTNLYEKFLVAPTTTEEELKERQSEIEAMLHIRSDFFHPNLRPDYLKTIHSLANDILDKMSNMMHHCKPREEMYQLQQDSFHRLKSVEELFAKQNAVFQSMTIAQRTKFRSNEEKIKATTLDFDDFDMPFAGAPGYAKVQMQEDLMVGMGLFRAAGFALDAAEQGLNRFAEITQMACEANPFMPAPLSMPLCVPTLAQKAYDGIPGLSDTMQSFNKELGESLPKPNLNFVQRVQQDYDRAIQTMANLYESEFGIPKQITTQFGADLPKVGKAVALTAATGGVLKGVSFLTSGASRTSFAALGARSLPESAFSLRTKMVEMLEADSGSVSLGSPINKLTSASARAHEKYNTVIAQEKVFIEHRLATIPKYEKPSGHPEHLIKFYSDCEAHPFKMRNIGAEGKGSIRGNILYQTMNEENDVFIFLSMGPRSKEVWKRFGNKDLVRSRDLYFEDRLDQLINVTLDMAKDKGFNHAIYAYDPKVHAVATTLEKKSIKVIGQGTFSRGRSVNSLTTIQIEIPK